LCTCATKARENSHESETKPHGAAKMPPDRLNFANLIPSEKGVPNPNIPKKEKRPSKAKAYELIRLKV